MSSESHTLLLCFDDETDREEGKLAENFYDKRIQKHTITRWKVALERLRVGNMLKFRHCLLTVCRARITEQ